MKPKAQRPKFTLTWVNPETGKREPYQKDLSWRRVNRLQLDVENAYQWQAKTKIEYQ